MRQAPLTRVRHLSEDGLLAVQNTSGTTDSALTRVRHLSEDGLLAVQNAINTGPKG